MKIEAITQKQFNVTIHQISELINRNNGWVTNHQMFSNLMAMIAFEMDAKKLDEFLADLKNIGIKVTNCDRQMKINKDGDFAGHISITFSNSDPDFKREVLPFG